MFIMKYILSLFYFQLTILGEIQVELYHTNEYDSLISHDCLRVVYSSGTSVIIDRDIKYFCLNEYPCEWQIKADNQTSKFTFDKLKEKNISSEQLYLWSAPIDIIEEYQSFLNDSNRTSYSWFVYWNCTWPRFGPQCQYEFYHTIRTSSSLNALIQSLYALSTTTLTCYIHLNCTRQSKVICLQWRDICDGEIQCLDTGEDEKDCWQLEINQCKANEYRCRNGQCIPKIFYEEIASIPGCIDGSDRKRGIELARSICTNSRMPSFICEDLTCEHLRFASSCLDTDVQYLIKQIFLDDNNKTKSSVSDNCRLAIKCLISILHLTDQTCRRFCSNSTCIQIVNETCPTIVVFGLNTDQLGDIHFVFQKTLVSNENIGLLYMCYRDSIYDSYFPSNSYVIFNQSKCLFHEVISYRINEIYFNDKLETTPLRRLYDKLRRFHTIPNENLNLCNQSNIYRCKNSSKCISIYRFNNGFNDCPHMDDEDRVDIDDYPLGKLYYQCQASNKSIHPNLLQNRRCDCGYIEENWCEDEDTQKNSIRRQISFQTICDGFQELIPIFIDGQEHTDETECQIWECNSVYTRCDRIWNCPNGDDEAGCPSDFELKCSIKHHYCVSSQTNQLICLSIERINDGIVDCLGGTDEPSLCRRIFKNTYNSSFYCGNMCIDPLKLCDGKNHCLNGEDEQFCGQTSETFLRQQFQTQWKSEQVKVELLTTNQLIENETIYSTNSIQSFQSETSSAVRCHRGIDVRVWLDFENRLSRRTCLCPLSFFGRQCQYQNQRVTLTIQFRAFSDSWQTLFAIVIRLIDDSHQRISHSYEQISFLWQIHCQSKFHFYLLYANRTKDLSRNYSIQIDFYEKDSLKYRGSSLFPIGFTFLPVNRLSILVDIPQTDEKSRICSNRKCIHGKCIRDRQGQTFCHCDEGWSGDDCSIAYDCRCSSDSRCIGLLPNNRSICVCRTNQFGSRCFLNDTICQKQDNSTCLHDGRCISNVDQLFSTKNKFVCICRDGFSGDRCEIVDNQVVFSFSKDLILPSLIYIHFIYKTVSDVEPKIETRFQMIRHEQRSVSVITLHFDLLFFILIELDKKEYYLTTLRENLYSNRTYHRTISSSNRCSNISELFNETFVQLPLIRRIKYYHQPCEKVSCFYDETHFCLCYPFNGKRLANCFRFDHKSRFDCDERSECENEGQCFQDDRTCPKRAICLCEPCFYGRRCHLSTNGFGLSLDGILGYHIEPNLSLSQQSSIVQFTLVLTIIFFLCGLIDGVLSSITFKKKPVCDTGCRIYLLCSSITTIFISILLMFKFLIVLSAHMRIISNRLFLQIQCYLLDFFLRVCLNFDQWLTACVAVKRTFTVFKEIRFDKEASRKAAKYVIISLVIVLIGSSIQDPLHRRLIDERNDDNDEIKRTWCVITYSSIWIRRFDSYMHTFHFLVSFTMNFVSAILLITIKSRQQLRIHKNHSYKRILHQQFQQHKNLLIAPIVLVLLALPRLILTFITRCMQSSDDAWLYINLYMIAFIPSILTFVVFVLPSKFYRKELKKTLTQYRAAIQRRLLL